MSKAHGDTTDMDEKLPLKRRILNGVVSLLRDAAKTSYDLFKITVPISLITKVLKDLGVVDYLGTALGPIMEVLGLPGSMGLVWATSMVTNLYGGMVVFASLAPAESLTIAQVTVLTTMMLVAHALPVEVRIAQKAGPRLLPMLGIRVIGAFVIGLLLHALYAGTGYLQEPNVALWNPPPPDPSWGAWFEDEVRNMLAIFLIIMVLLFLMKFLKWVGITPLLTRLLEPVLRMLGMGREAAPLTIIGMTLGLAYGGGLIIQESQSGRLGKRDVFFSLALMCLCHSLIEDTLLMMALGGHLSGILWIRLVFSLVVVFVMVKLLNRVSDETFDKHFFKEVVQEKVEQETPAEPVPVRTEQ